ncbi:MAG TPA: hypothetical protein VMI31_15285, partial [Fimbriimonadaceae bacterium]|nr:hypothetical protein [Fimbriimonadaceae bacterium]
MRFFQGLQIASALIVGCLAASARGQYYTIYPIAPNGPFAGAYAYGINDNGDITGVGFDPVTGEDHAFIYSNGIMQDLGDFGYPYGADGIAINDSDQLAAIGYGPGYQALRYSNGAAHRIGNIDGGYTEGLSINSSGNIVGRGMNGDGGYQGFTYIGGIFTALGVDKAESINNANDYVGSIGYYWVYGGYVHGVEHAFLYSGGTTTDLGDIGGGVRTNTEAYALNNLDQVVGYSTAADGTIHGFLYSGGVMQDIGTIPPYYAYPCAINDSGLIVGNLETYVGGPVGPFIYSGGMMRQLADVLDSSGDAWTGLTITALNNSGRIVGYGTYNGNGEGFVAIPTLPVSGVVVLENYSASAVAGTPVTVEVRAPGSTTALDSQVVNLASDGSFTLSTQL